MTDEEKENLWLEYKLQAIQKAQIAGTSRSSRSMRDYDLFSGKYLEHSSSENSSDESNESNESNDFDSDQSLSLNSSPFRRPLDVNGVIPSPIGYKSSRDSLLSIGKSNIQTYYTFSNATRKMLISGIHVRQVHPNQQRKSGKFKSRNLRRSDLPRSPNVLYSKPECPKDDGKAHIIRKTQQNPSRVHRIS